MDNNCIDKNFNWLKNVKNKLHRQQMCQQKLQVAIKCEKETSSTTVLTKTSTSHKM